MNSTQAAPKGALASAGLTQKNQGGVVEAPHILQDVQHPALEEGAGQGKRPIKLLPRQCSIRSQGSKSFLDDTSRPLLNWRLLAAKLLGLPAKPSKI